MTFDDHVACDEEIAQLKTHLAAVKKRAMRLARRLDAEQEKNRWIPVGERLPEEKVPNGLSRRVWCYNSKLQETWEGRYIPKINKWTRTFPYPTHWRPIDPPEGE